MKKTLLLSLCTLVLSANAQFKVQSDGKIAIRTNSTALSPISINGAGYDVTTSIPYGNVSVENGSKLTISKSNGVLLKNGFECKAGGELQIK